MSDSSDTHLSSLSADVEAQAQAEAERFFGTRPVAVWRPSSVQAERTPWVRCALRFAAAGCVAVTALVAAVAGAGWTRDGNNPPESPVAGDPSDDIVDEPLNVQLPMRVVDAAPPPPSSPTLNITRRGAEWRIEAVGVSRLVAAQRLAQLSGSPLLGDIAPLAAARPLDLRWQGRGAASAWQAVLGPELSFATQCGAVRCRVWILEAGTGGPGQAQEPAPRTPATVPQLPVAFDVATAPPQSDNADPRIASHHD